jgi:MFS family permease
LATSSIHGAGSLVEMEPTDSVNSEKSPNQHLADVKTRDRSPVGLVLLPWRLCRAAYVVTVEPIVFLFMFGVYLMLFTSQQYFFWRYGSEVLARNGTPSVNGCISADDLGDSVVDVQKSSSRLLSYVYVPGQVMCIFTALFLGSLSDTLGRKFIFYLVGTGVVLQGLVSLVVVLYKLDLRLFIIGGVLSGFFGGFASILATSFSYAADISSPGRGRSIRISIIEAMIFVAGLVSEGGAGKVIELLNCSFWPLIAVYIGSGVLMILYTALFLREPFSRSERLQRAADSPKGIGRLLRGLRLFFCPSTYSTWKLWAALGVLVIIAGNFVGTQTITAIFQAGPPLKWGPAMIGYYAMVAMATHGVVTLLLLPLMVTLSLPDVLIALIGVSLVAEWTSLLGLFTATGRCS